MLKSYKNRLQNRSRQKSLVSSINMTPFVDVVLVLLIIFMVTAPMLSQALHVKLPKVSSAMAPVMNKAPVVLSINQDGSVTCNSEPRRFSLLEVRSKLQTLNLGSGQKVLVAADTHVPYGVVVQVLNLIRDLGITKVGLLGTPAN